jgi:hypothetical protein
MRPFEWKQCKLQDIRFSRKCVPTEKLEGSLSRLVELCNRDGEWYLGISRREFT